MLAAVDFNNPLLWAALIGWILSVVLHEFAHGLVGYLGGDYTIRERGGLTLNPLQYVDPVMSILLPAIFLLMGGIPLPGGATYIRRDLLRSPLWSSAVSLAGPAMNLLLFFACAMPLHPTFGWADYSNPYAEWTNEQSFLAAMAVLQLFAVMLNIVPIPPLDGYGVISPFLTPEIRAKFANPQVRIFCLVGYFLVLNNVPAVSEKMMEIIVKTLLKLGFGHIGTYKFLQSFAKVLYGGQ